MPEIEVAGGQRPEDTVEGQPAAHVRVVKNDGAVVEAGEIEISNLPVNEGRGGGQQQTDE